MSSLCGLGALLGFDYFILMSTSNLSENLFKSITFNDFWTPLSLDSSHSDVCHNSPSENLLKPITFNDFWWLWPLDPSGPYSSYFDVCHERL